MGLRTVLYGYRKNYLSYNIIPEEADVVRKIFREYISGKTMKEIADDLTRNHVLYYEEKYIWTKNAVCRIIENEHYAGDLEYPSIISQADYDAANAMKTDKGGKREADTYETALLKRKMFCSECGHRFTRRKNYSGNRERWECPNYCKLTLFLDDKALFEKLKNLLNAVIDDPNTLHHNECSTEPYEPSLELIRQNREIERLTEQKSLQFLPIKEAIFDAASKRYDCCRIDYTKAITDKLIEYIRTVDKSESVDFALIEKVVKTITVHTDGNLSVRFLNNKIINEPGEEKDGNNNT